MRVRVFVTIKSNDNLFSKNTTHPLLYFKAQAMLRQEHQDGHLLLLFLTLLPLRDGEENERDGGRVLWDSRVSKIVCVGGLSQSDPQEQIETP